MGRFQSCSRSTDRVIDTCFSWPISTGMLKLILLMLMLLHRVSAQDLTVSSQESTFRLAGQGLFSRTCRYSGNDASFLRLDWYLNGTLHPRGMGVMGDKLNRLILQPPTINDAGVYNCTAVFSDGNSVHIGGGSLMIINPAQVINAPTIQYVSAGDSTVLNCSTTFPRHLIFITWLYNSSTISNVINSASLEHAGQYNCLIYETVTSVVIYRANIQLVVIDVRVSSINDTVQMLGRGSFSRTCTYNGSETHFTRLDWSLNGSTHSMGMGDVGMKYNHLFIQQPTIEDAGEYACSAIFPNYSSIPVSAGSLRFLPPPFINVSLIDPNVSSLTVSSQHNTFRIAGHGSFGRTCWYNGSYPGFVRLDWLLNGTLHPRGKGVVGVKLNSLILQPLTVNDAGMYTCQALFSIGKTISISGGSILIFSPVIYAPTIQYVSAGDSTVLNCSTAFAPSLIHITWFYSNSPISNVINNANLQHARQYICRIYESETDAVLYRVDIDLVVIDVRVSSINDTVQVLGRGNFSRTCTYNGSETHFTRLDWSLDGNTHSIGMGNVGIKYNHLFIQQPTVEDAGEYTCSAIFPNYSSIPVSAGSLRFHFLPGPPFNVYVEHISNSSVLIEARLSHIGTTPILSAHLKIAIAGNNISRAVYSASVTKDLTLGKVVEFFVTDLLPATTYSVFLYAVNIFGRGQVSEKNFTTVNVPVTPTVNAPRVVLVVFFWLFILISGIVFTILCVYNYKIKMKHASRVLPPLDSSFLDLMKKKFTRNQQDSTS